MTARVAALAAAILLLAFPAIAQRQAPAREPARAIGEIRLEQLPREARATLDLIRKGGPFPYAKDGAIFGNREAILPRRKRGYYREYTVKTPGERTRGARRIVAGAPGEYYYTEDHYDSFSRIRE
ncbi:MAG TPA: ribonuclease domain-containing protein [Usitatibacter sp.]|nr:ribonuclease domain-containing protein [Usitatibacter sp.]